MKVFLSWSGSKSHAIALLLQKYLPSLINSVEPWLSSQDIAVGARWNEEITDNLETSNQGIFCLTAENQTAPWMLFEAGAISKLSTVGRALILRIELQPSEITGPFSQFQSVALDRAGIRRIILDVNSSQPSPVSTETLELTFNALWQSMDSEFHAALTVSRTEVPSRRSTDDMLNEILELARRQAQFSPATPAIFTPSRQALGFRSANVTLESKRLGRRPIILHLPESLFQELQSMALLQSLPIGRLCTGLLLRSLGFPNEQEFSDASIGAFKGDASKD